MSKKDKKLLKEAKSLPWDERLTHTNWKVRNDANIDLAAVCDSITDPKDPRLQKFGSLFQKTVADSNAPVQEKALDALIAYLKAADADVGRNYGKEVCDAIVAKCLTGTPKTVEKAQMIFKLWVELEAVGPFLDAMEKAIKNKDAKAVVPAIDVMSQALSEFGSKILPAERILKMLPELFAHQDQNVRASSKELTLELCRWIGKDAVKLGLFEKMRDTMKKELDAELVNVSRIAAKPTRKIRSEQDKEPEPEVISEASDSRPLEESNAEANMTSPPPEDGSGYFKLSRRYKLHQLKSYPAVENADPTAQYYYQGRLLPNALDGDRDRLLDGEEDVSFLCFDPKDVNRASSIFRCSNEINDPNNLKCHFLRFDNEVNKYLLCCEKIDFFFEENTEFLELRKERTMSKLPHPKVQTEALGIMVGIHRMHLKGITNSQFDSTRSYVWCKGHLKTFGDFSRGGMSNKDWHKQLKLHMQQLKNFVDKDLLKSDEDWPKKDSFLKCFDHIGGYSEKSLNMFVQHPFLVGDKLSYVDYFSTVGHAVSHTRRNKMDNGFDSAYLIDALDTGVLDNDIRSVDGTKKATWRRSGMHEKFEGMMEAVENTDRKYRTDKAEGLLYYLRDVSEHHDDEMDMKTDEVHEEIDKQWPCFIYEIHEQV